MYALEKDIQKIGRLKKRADFLHVNAQKKFWVTPGFTIQIAQADRQVCHNYGLTVTKKTFKRAVDRNRVKRRLRTLATSILPKLETRIVLNIVFIGRKEALTLPYAALEKDLRWALRKLDLKIEDS